MGSLRYFNLKDIKQQYRLQTFFETGAGTGTGIEYAREIDFLDIYSVEIIKEQAALLRGAFAGDKRVRLIADSSESALRQHLPNLPFNTLFFLDAHFPGADLGLKAFDAEQDEDLRLPLLKELELIRDLRAARGFKDVILLDDLMIFDDDHVYPDSHLKKEHAIAPKKLVNQYQQILDVLKATHEYKVLPDYSGYVVIYPK